MIRIKLLVILGIALFLSLGGSAILFQQYLKVRGDRERISENFFNKNQEIQRWKDKNGTLHSAINALNLKESEFKRNNSKLQSELENMRIKLKRVNSVSNTVISYKYKHDTVYSAKPVVTSTVTGALRKVYYTNITNQWLSSSWESTLSENNDKLLIDKYSVQLNDSLLFVTENVYKGWWIFRKLKGVRLHVKSKNIYSNIDQIEYIEIHRK